MKTLTRSFSPRTPFSSLVALLALAVSAHAAIDAEPGSPSFEIAGLDGGRTLVEWTSSTRWEDLAEEDVLSVPLGGGEHMNALVLGPGVDVGDVLEEVEEQERAQAAETGPVLRYDVPGLFSRHTLGFPIELEGLPSEEELDELGEKGDDPRDTTPPTEYGEEIDDPKSYALSFKFFAGDAKKKRAVKRIKAARKFYVKAFDWWEEQIEDKCEFEIEVEDLGDDTKTLTRVVEKKKRKVTVGYSRYSTDAEWAKAPRYTWLVGEKLRNRLLRSPAPSTRFHLAIFKVDGIRWRRAGKKSRSEHVLPRVGIGIFRKPVQDKIRTAIHEVGHFLGLRDGDGAVMTYASKASQRGGSLYGEKKFRKSWCDKIEASVQGPA